jgi:hypothetical protein
VTVDDLKVQLDGLPGDAQLFTYSDGYRLLGGVVEGNGGFVLMPT